MAHTSVGRRVTETVAGATGRSDSEVRLAFTGAAVTAAVAAGLFVGLRFLKFLADLGTNVFSHR